MLHTIILMCTTCEKKKLKLNVASCCKWACNLVTNRVPREMCESFLEDVRGDRAKLPTVELRDFY